MKRNDNRNTVTDWGSLLEGWAEEFGTDPVKARDIYKFAVREDLLPRPTTEAEEHAAKTSLGIQLSKGPQTDAGRFRVERGPPDRHEKVKRWRVVERSFLRRLCEKVSSPVQMVVG